MSTKLFNQTPLTSTVEEGVDGTTIKTKGEEITLSTGKLYQSFAGEAGLTAFVFGGGNQIKPLVVITSAGNDEDRDTEAKQVEDKPVDYHQLHNSIRTQLQVAPLGLTCTEEAWQVVEDIKAGTRTRRGKPGKPATYEQTDLIIALGQLLLAVG